MKPLPTPEEIAREVRQRRRNPPHVHRCPECYEAAPCGIATCTMEPDLDLDNGIPAGTFATCSGCAARLGGAP